MTRTETARTVCRGGAGSMTEYISRDDALEIRVSEGYNNDGILFIPYRDVREHLRSIPAADVRPMVHGRWVATYFPDCVYARCDQCRVSQIFYHNKPLTTYCPNCGAVMDGGPDR